MSHYHEPVMLKEVLAFVPAFTEPKESLLFLDLTFGGGGHSRAILQNMPERAALWAFDQDSDAAMQAKQITDPRFRFFQANFRFFGQFLEAQAQEGADFILADLGVSSHQFDTPERGFSFRFPQEPLDMRMNRQAPLSAADILNNYSAEELQRVLSWYGEVKNARTLAKSILAARSVRPLRTVADLNAVIEKHAPRHKAQQYFAKVYQAIRIEVNDEMGALREMLKQAAKYLRPGGRIVVISYHSLEDRLVKHFFATGSFRGQEPPRDLYGNLLTPLQPVTRKALGPSEEEIRRNPRARSAKLRVAERIT
ncbi:16S rRNA (cytosine1402-N4)-methyltransferase [Thermonema lapsum]|uniref:Ribosomal RNA small subunit methyltransferase H n=1 Tax=Thermonema lapsum TaxID=28195 RepID=A0A846MTJ3_9BACT|nr:16S rRNA (cytosine(1402)-N(4))-methyltransferase RsmH [Thermonema lapsum]NIK74547.1 16S rRNA (cytosine1402-N4)-methyltransferase [Thermonema lapsum]